MTELQSNLNALELIVEQLVSLDLPEPVSGRDFRWRELDHELKGQIAGRRVLVVGDEVRGDAAAFADRGASYVLACLTATAGDEVEEQESAGQPRVDVQPISWHELDPARHGTYEIVHCNGLLHRVTEPLAMLGRLRSMTAREGTLLIGSMLMADPERSEYLRFIPDRYAGDPTWWFLPGRLAFRWLVQTAGFDVQQEFAEREGPRDLMPIVAGYLRATAS